MLHNGFPTSNRMLSEIFNIMHLILFRKVKRNALLQDLNSKARVCVNLQFLMWYQKMRSKFLALKIVHWKYKLKRQKGNFSHM